MEWIDHAHAGDVRHECGYVHAPSLRASDHAHDARSNGARRRFPLEEPQQENRRSVYLQKAVSRL